MYTGLAAVYDRIQNMDISAWADFVIRLEQLYSQRTGQGDGRDGRPLLLDLGCGTGGFCLEMARRGYDPIGVDISAAMLDRARQKQAQAEECLFLQQDISRFELFGTVDLIVSLLDTVNHLTRKADLRRMFRLCANYLNPGGVMIFDLLCLGYMEKTLANNIFFFEEDDYSLVWQNSFWPGRLLNRAELTLFIRTENAFYQRFTESISERYYTAADIKAVLAGSGLSLLACHGGHELADSQAGSRDFFVEVKKLGQCKNSACNFIPAVIK